MSKENLYKPFLAVLVILIWLSVPIYLQFRHGYSAVKISFAITIIYYIGFKLWKFKSNEAATV